MKRILVLLVTIVVFLTGCDDSFYFQTLMDENLGEGPSIVEISGGSGYNRGIDNGDAPSTSIAATYLVTTEEYGDICKGTCYRDDEETAKKKPLVIDSNGCDLIVTINYSDKKGNKVSDVEKTVTIHPGESKLMSISSDEFMYHDTYYIYIQSSIQPE